MLNFPGVYALLLKLEQTRNIQIGQKGTFIFPAGSYLYLGSAQGPGGLAGRLNRHCRDEKTLRWHIDFFRQVANLEQAWAYQTTRQLECHWATSAMNLPDAGIPVSGLGSSDCRCPAHLFHYPTRPDPFVFAQTAMVPLSEFLFIACQDGAMVKVQSANELYYGKKN